jgi:hypothetical protein
METGWKQDRQEKNKEGQDEKAMLIEGEKMVLVTIRSDTYRMR